MATNPSALSATSSARSRFESRLSPTRAAWVAPRPADHRHPHPERLAARGGAVVGKGVERDIDLVVKLEMGGLTRDPAVHREPRGIDAPGLEPRAEIGPRAGIGQRLALHDKAGVGNSGEHRRPERNRLVTHLAEIVERAEGNMPCTARRQGGERRAIGGRAEAMEAPGQAHQLFAVPGVGDANGIGQPVGQAIIHGAHAGGRGIAQIGDLHGRGFAGEHGKPIACRVACKIDQDAGDPDSTAPIRRGRAACRRCAPCRRPDRQ